MNANKEPFKSRSLRGAALLAIAIFAVEALFSNQYFIAIFTMAYVVLVGLPRAMLSARWREARRRQLANLGMYFCAAVAAFTANVANNHLAAQRAQVVIAAVENFKASTGKYPGALSELVPAFLPDVPDAKFGFGFNKFYYYAHANGASLMYVVYPPFGRQTYDFETKSYGYLD